MNLFFIRIIIEERTLFGIRAPTPQTTPSIRLTTQVTPQSPQTNPVNLSYYTTFPQATPPTFQTMPHCLQNTPSTFSTISRFFFISLHHSQKEYLQLINHQQYLPKTSKNRYIHMSLLCIAKS